MSLCRFIFWTDISKYPKIERATLTGNNREVIVSSGLVFPICINVDVTGSKRRIYWADASLDTIESANLSGGERRIVKQMSDTEFYDMAVFRVCKNVKYTLRRFKNPTFLFVFFV